MFQLLPGYNAVKWTGATVPIRATACLPVIRVVHVVGPDRVSWRSFEPGDALSTMERFVQGVDYLIEATAPFLLPEATLASAGAFAAFPGYEPALPDVSPTAPTGSIVSGVAAGDIIGGRLVAQTLAGLVHYSSGELSHWGLLLGVALNSARAGGSVSVQGPGYVEHPGWSLPLSIVLLAGADGRVTTSLPATSFYQVIGRALSPDVLLYQPGPLVLLSTPQTLSANA